MPLQIIKGDIFTSKANYLVCPVNCEGVMGNGLAKEFKQRFPKYEDVYRCNTNCNGKPFFSSFNDDIPALNKIGDFLLCSPILFFVTKKEWRNKSDLELIKRGLLVFKKAYVNNHSSNYPPPLGSFAFPALGCGEGGLNWLDVKAMFEEVFQDCENLIELYEPIN